MDFPQPSHMADAQPSRAHHVRKRVEPFFFNPSLKLATLRLAIFCSVVAIGTAATSLDITDNYTRAYIGTVSFVLVHQIVSAFKLRFMIRLLDLLLATAELLVLIYFHGPETKYLNRLTPTAVVVVFIAGWGLTGTLFFLLLCRWAAIIRHKGRNLLKGFDLMEDALRIKGIPIANCPAAYSLLIGRSIWRIQFAGESLSARLLRGSVAGAFIFALIGYAIIALFIEPLKETAFVPVKESRGAALDPYEETEPQTWNFAFSRRIYAPSPNGTPGLNTSERFHSAITVTPLWDDRKPDDKPPCEHLQDVISPGDKPLQIIHVRCPGRTIPPDESSYRSDWMPDILIEVNYETLMIEPDVTVSLLEGVIGVYAGFTNDPMYLTRKMKSIPLPPSAHYLAPISIEIRKALKHPALSALGMFETQNTFWVPRIGHIVPDPLATLDPPVFNMSRTSASFRFFYHLDVSEVRVFEEDREKSILGGFSAIGGLWTFLGGIFALLFGTTLMRIFFGSKELSIFGLAQQLEKDKIAKAYLHEYPQIQQELNLPRSQRGIMSLLQDHMVDVELFREAIDDSQTTQDDPKRTYDVEGLGSTATIPQHVQYLTH